MEVFRLGVAVAAFAATLLANTPWGEPFYGVHYLILMAAALAWLPPVLRVFLRGY